ncbi:MAG: hypothetical protein JXA97_10020 [Anaerolineales bacterium]|nr:hypothetical protein [Anaerolineales bacterium]
MQIQQEGSFFKGKVTLALDLLDALLTEKTVCLYSSVSERDVVVIFPALCRAVTASAALPSSRLAET